MVCTYVQHRESQSVFVILKLQLFLFLLRLPLVVLDHPNLQFCTLETFLLDINTFFLLC